MISGGVLASNVSLSFGLEADKPTNPKQGNQYFCTDTVKLLACATNGKWEELTDKTTRINTLVNALKIATLNNLTLQGLNNAIIDTFTDMDNITISGLSLSAGSLVAEGAGLLTPTGVIYSSYYSGYPASRISDNSISDAWVADHTEGTGEYAGVDLGSIMSFNRVVINIGWGLGSYTFDDFEIQVSDDATNWTTVHTETGYFNSWVSGDNTFDFLKVSARYCRIYATAGNGQLSTGVLNEFDVYNVSPEISITGDAITLDGEINQCNVLVMVNDANTETTTISISVDGVNWDECTNIEKETNQNGGHYLTGSVTITHTGMELQYKIESTSILSVYGVGLTW